MKEAGLCGMIGVIGSWLSGLFGGWDHAMLTLILFMIIDYITGMITAGVFKKSNKTENGALESRAGWKGICRKGVTLFVVLIAHRLDVVLGSDFIRNAVIIAYIVNEAISVIENAGLMGIPIPAALKDAIAVLKSKKGKEEGKNERNHEQ